MHGCTFSGAYRAGMQLFTTLDAAEVLVVARVVASSERLRLDRLARVGTRLGNGWLYPLLSLLIVAAEIERPLRFLAAASLSLLLAFAVYPMLKTSLGRSRPSARALHRRDGPRGLTPRSVATPPVTPSRRRRRSPPACSRSSRTLPPRTAGEGCPG